MERKKKDGHRERRTEASDWKKNREVRKKRDSTERDGRDRRCNKIHKKSPRSNLNVYHLN